MTEPPVTVPVCYRHPSRETYVRCARCERPICPDCMRDAAVGHQCPECVAEGRRTQRPVRTAFGGGVTGELGRVTTTLIAVNVLVAVVGVLLGGARTLFDGGLFTGVSEIQLLGGTLGTSITVAPDGSAYGGAVPELGRVYVGIADGAYYRLVTAIFIHYGVFHLLMNMYALWLLGRNLEGALGPGRFLALYLLAGIGGNVAAFAVQPGAVGAGASTAIFGLFAALFIVLRRLKRDTSGLIPLLVINLVLGVVIAQSLIGHLGGVVTGALVGAILAYAPRQRRTLVQVAGCAGVLVLLLVVTALRSATLTG
ncbi:MAG TPA: rhomboid family intramembrane serine protease [Pilimelia sp.]|nr:rhomboid family intramembrane serine protease [Pilimelia sp.]